MAMKTFNYYVQLGIVISILLILLATIFENGLMMLILYLQFGVGVYQFLVGAFFAYRNALNGQFRVYFLAALANLLCLSLFTVIEPDDFRLVTTLLAFVIPWILAIYFMILSYQYHKKP